jgi:hypothetical protein
MKPTISSLFQISTQLPPPHHPAMLQSSIYNTMRCQPIIKAKSSSNELKDQSKHQHKSDSMIKDTRQTLIDIIA